MRYNVSFQIISKGNVESKFEVVDINSQNYELIPAALKKKYKKGSIHIRYIHESKTGNGELV